MRQTAFRLLDPVAGAHGIKRVFEGGCGTGYFAHLVGQRYGLPVFAADLDAAAARFCSEKRGVVCARADLGALPFPAASFDLVLAMDVLAHFEAADTRPMRELVRVLRPGGFLLVRTSALKVFRSRHSDFVWERQRFSKRRLRALAESHGVTVQRLCYANFLLSPIALLKFRVWEPLTRSRPASGLESLPPVLERMFYEALRLESRLIARGFDAPFGQSLYLLARKPPAAAAS
jgi:SAM-dependent methyltransferase